MNTDEQLKQLKELLECQEDLDAELLPYFEEESDHGWPMIRHPLVYSIMHTQNQNAMVNAQLRAKKKALASAIIEERWHSYVYLHERPYRVEAFEVLANDLDVFDDETGYWELLGSIWTDSENIHQNEGMWRDFLTDPRPGRESMMNEAERTALAEDYDDTITVYRGFTVEGREEGLSWTSNSVVAKFFARRLARPDQTPMMATGTVNKSNVIAFFDGRSEQELVVLPEDIQAVDVTEVKDA